MTEELLNHCRDFALKNNWKDAVIVQCTYSQEEPCVFKMGDEPEDGDYHWFYDNPTNEGYFSPIDLVFENIERAKRELERWDIVNPSHQQYIESIEFIRLSSDENESGERGKRAIRICES